MTRSAAPLSILLALLAVGPADGRGRHGPTGRLFISPMGEPFRSDLDGDPEAAWIGGADADHDGRISLAEFQADAQRWFHAIDRGRDGEIDPDDIDYYENQLVPEIRVADAPRGNGGARLGSGGGGRGNPGSGRGGRGGGGVGGGGLGGGGLGGGGLGGGGLGGGRGGRGGGGQDGDRSAAQPQSARAIRQGAARYSYLDFPEPLTAADTNLNRGIDKDEMAHAAAERFASLDKNGDGYLDRHELPRVDTRSTGPGPRPGGGQRPPRPAPGHEEDEE